MKRAILEINEMALDIMFIVSSGETELHLLVEHGLPEDAKMVGIWHDFTRRVFQLAYESDEFAEIREGERMPVLPPVKFTRLEDGEQS